MAQKFTQQETEEFVDKLWSTFWSGDVEQLSSVLHDEAELSCFSPPRMTTFKGIENIKKRFLEVEPMLSGSDVKIHRVDRTTPPTNSYHEKSIMYKMKSGPLASDPAQEMRETVYMIRDEASGKVKLIKIWEDPTMFVEYALKGMLPVGDLTQLSGKSE